MSALDRELVLDDGTTMTLIQTSAAINFGNSGGPLLNQYGQVVGITTIKIVSDDGSAESLGFAIPSSRVRYVVNQLLAGEEVRRAVFGFTVSTIPVEGGGLELLEVDRRSDGWTQGLRPGDIVTAVDGRPVTGTQDLSRVRQGLGPGDTVSLTYLRDGVSHTVEMALTDEADLSCPPPAVHPGRGDFFVAPGAPPCYTGAKGGMSMFNTTLCYIRRGEDYLMLHRIKKEHDLNRDKWIGIGGKFEDKESPEDCLLREVREETGLTLTRYRYRGIITFVSDRWPTEYMHLFTADGFSGALKECDEGVLEWLPRGRLLELPHWEGDAIFLKLIEDDGQPFFSLKLRYEGEALAEAVLDGKHLRGGPAS